MGWTLRLMGKKDPRVDAYIENAAPFARPILKRLRKWAHSTAPIASRPSGGRRRTSSTRQALFRHVRIQGALRVRLLTSADARRRHLARRHGTPRQDQVGCRPAFGA